MTAYTIACGSGSCGVTSGGASFSTNQCSVAVDTIELVDVEVEDVILTDVRAEQ